MIDQQKFWEIESTLGKGAAFESPEALWGACQEFFTWVHENPLYEQKAFSNGKKIDLPKMRAMTTEGLLIFLGICPATWSNYKYHDSFKDTVEMVEMVMRTQKFTAGAADLMNANIIARDLGLADKKQVDAPGLESLLEEIMDESRGLPSDR